MNIKLNATADTMGNTEVDPLSVPACDVPPPAYPVLAEKRHRLICRQPEIANYNNVDYLKFRLETTEDAMSTQDDKIYAGFKFSTLQAVQETEWATKKDIAEQLGQVIRAFFGKTTKVTARDLINDPSMLADKPVDAIVGIQKAKGDKPAQNRVKTWITPA